MARFTELRFAEQRVPSLDFAIKKNNMCKVVALHGSSSGFVTGVHRHGPLSERV
jgi:hypothetical protein